MNMPSLTLGRPLGAALVLGGILLAALAAVGASWAGLSAATEERDAKADLLERGVAASRRAPGAAGPRAADPFVPADTATLAAAAIDADLRALASASGLVLLSSRSDAKADEPGNPSGATGGAEGIGTRIEEQAVLEGQNEGIRALLIRLESGTPAVLVDALALQPAEAAEGAPADAQAPRLRLSLTLSAYWRPVKAAPPR